MMQKKGFVTEEDISTVIRRYPAITVLRLLQEVARSPNAKIDWKALVAKTDTKISNAREYQMLWRHLAYGHALLEKFEDEEPLNDDSDLEYEVEVFPPVSAEASAEAAACVKVLMASGLPREAGVLGNSHVEAPLTINIPSGHTSKVSVENSLASSSLQGTNISIPISVQKQSTGSFSGQKHPLSRTTSSEAIGANVSATTGLPPRKKRKPWSEEEDMELIAAVKKCGEGNWANISKGDFKGERTASQLSQRWSSIRKKKSDISVGGSTQVKVNTNAAIRAAFEGASKQPSVGTAVNSNHATLKAPKEEYLEVSNACESQLQTINISHQVAINGDEFLEQSQNHSHQVGTNVSQSQQQPHKATSDVAQCQDQPPRAPHNFAQSQKQPQGADHVAQSHQRINSVQSQQGLNPTSSMVKAHHLCGSTPASMSKSRPAPMKVPVKPSLSPDPMIKAVAVAAGARIASPSEANLFKAAQAKNAVHIMSSGSANSLSSSVHYIRTSSPATSPPKFAGIACQTTGSQQMRGTVEPSTQNAPLSQHFKAAKSTVSPEHIDIPGGNPVNEHQQIQVAESMTLMEPLASNNTPNSGSQDAPTSTPSHLPSDQLDNSDDKECNLLAEGSIVANQAAVESDQGVESIGIADKSSDNTFNRDVEGRDAEHHFAIHGDSELSLDLKPENQKNTMEAVNSKLEASAIVDSRAETQEQKVRCSVGRT